MINIPEQTLILIMMLPVVATVIAFLRQIVGIKAFGIYTPLIITFAFLSTGLSYGLLIFMLVLISGTLARLLLRRFRLLYLPRMAIVLSMVALVIFGLFWASQQVSENELYSISIFPILIIITLVEKFVAAQIDKNIRTAIVLSAETLTLSVAAYFVASWPWLQQILLAQPAWLLVTLLINILMGRWTGLRLTEYFKFREVSKNAELSKK